MKTYSYDEVYNASVKYFSGNELSAKVFVDKYALKNDNGELVELTPHDMHRRIAKEIARIEKNKFKDPLSEEFILKKLEFFREIIPQGSPMYGIGNKFQYATLSNCYVIPSPVDSYGGIMKADEEIAQCSKRRGGVGLDISNLRPHNSFVKNAARTTSGAISFMERFSNTLREVGQNGRRGAGILTISIHHPDIEDFVNIKKNLTKVTGANISIRLTDEFLNAVDKNKDYELRFPVNSKNPTVSKTVKAKDIWDKIIDSAWTMAEPGLLFWNNILRESPADCYEKFQSCSVNPCQPANAQVYTQEGISNIGKIKVGDKILSKEGWTKVLKKWSSGTKPVFRYLFGHSPYNILGVFEGTENHRIVSNGVKTEIKNATSCDCLVFGVNDDTNLHDWHVRTSIPLMGIKHIGDKEVFDVTVDNKSHTYCTNGCIVSNCSEIVLSALDSCRLLAINLFAFVKNPYTKDAYFDFDALYENAQVAQRLMDDIIDLEIESIHRILDKINSDPEPNEVKLREKTLWKNILQACIEGRRTGTGITAIGDTIAACNIKYGSKKSIDFTEKIYKTLKLGTYRSSVDMAKEIGAFPEWDHNKEKNNPFLLRIKEEDPKLWNDMKENGRRNIAILTTAPTGSLSIEACVEVINKRFHNTTSGIEALFMESFTRRKKGNPGDKNFRSDFVDQNGDHWMEFKVYHEPINAWKLVNPDKDLEENPYNGCCAQDINWENRVKMQAAAQKHVCHSISSTINLPEDVSKDEVAKIYLTAWKSGCKGITVYRDNCRTGVLVNNNDKKEREVGQEAPKRPKQLSCDVYHITVKGTPYFVLLGLLDGTPYEVFAGNNCKEVVPKKVSSGKITKKARKKYHAEFDDGTELLPINAFCNDEEETVTRLCSTTLRHGVDISYLVHQLEKVPGDISSFAKSIARALKRNIKDGTQVKGEECPECHSELVRIEGCIQCKSCGFTKCG